jgi:hypothetical protein
LKIGVVATGEVSEELKGLRARYGALIARDEEGARGAGFGNLWRDNCAEKTEDIVR